MGPRARTIYVPCEVVVMPINLSDAGCMERDTWKQNTHRGQYVEGGCGSDGQ